MVPTELSVELNWDQTEVGEDNQENQPIRVVWLISLIGLVPIVIFTIAITFSGMQSGVVPVLIDAFKTYAAILLSFLGGIRWGVALNKDSQKNIERSILAATIAPLIGWVAIFVAEPLCFAILIVGYAGQGAWDNISAHRGLMPLWFARIRMIMTTLVVISLAVTMFATR